MGKIVKKKTKRKEEPETDYFMYAHALKTFIENKGLQDEFQAFYYSTDYTYPFNQAKDMQKVSNIPFIKRRIRR